MVTMKWVDSLSLGSPWGATVAGVGGVVPPSVLDTIVSLVDKPHAFVTSQISRYMPQNVYDVTTPESVVAQAAVGINQSGVSRTT